MNKLFTHEELELKNHLLLFKSKEEIVDMVLTMKNANRIYRSMLVRYNKTIKEIRESIMSFLLTEEYIKVDGKAIADNYHEILSILDKGLKERGEPND